MRSRLAAATRWLLWSPTRVRAALAVAATIGVALVVSAVAVVVQARPETPETATCKAATDRFVSAFVTAPKDAAWALRVGQTVTPHARPGVSGINPADTPTGPATVTLVEEDGSRCGATVALPGMTVALSVVERDGVWLVDAWGPR